MADMFNGADMLDCTVELFENGLDPDGGGRKTVFTYTGRCLFQECAEEAYSAEHRDVKLSGKALLEGDIAPGVPLIAGGRLRVAMPDGTERELGICSGRRVRVFGGRVHHTALGLV